MGIKTAQGSTRRWRNVGAQTIGNGADDHPGDNIAVVVPWALPDPFDGIKESDLYAVQWLVSRGSYRADAQAHEWVGHAVAKALGLEVERDKARIKRLIKTWIANRVLLVELRKEPKTSKLRQYIAVGEWAAPSRLPHHLDQGGGDGWEGGDA